MGTAGRGYSGFLFNALTSGVGKGGDAVAFVVLYTVMRCVRGKFLMYLRLYLTFPPSQKAAEGNTDP